MCVYIQYIKFKIHRAVCYNYEFQLDVKILGCVISIHGYISLYVDTVLIMRLTRKLYTPQNSTIKCGGGGGSSSASWRLAQARATHRTICTLLLAAHTALAAELETIMSILPPWATSANATNTTSTTSTPPTPQPTRLKVDNLSDVAKVSFSSSFFLNVSFNCRQCSSFFLLSYVRF